MTPQDARRSRATTALIQLRRSFAPLQQTLHRSAQVDSPALASVPARSVTATSRTSWNPAKPGKPVVTGNQSAVLARYTDRFKVSRIDERNYRWIELKNRMRVLLVSDHKANQSAAAIDVNVGSYSDPPAYPGLAHFCEHMLFLSNEKYPVEDEYFSFLSEHGGGANAFTANTHTNFFFEVQAELLKDALDHTLPLTLPPDPYP